MKNKVVQFSLVLVAISLFFFTYYYSSDKDKIADTEKNTLIEDTNLEDANTMILNASYSGYDGSNNFYEIRSETAITSTKDPNISYLKGVTATIRLSNLKIVEIQADEGIFHKTSNDATFSGHVIVKSEPGNKLFCDNLSLLMSQNKIFANDNVKYFNSITKSFVLGDKVELDMISNMGKIFMENPGDKVTVKYIN